MTDTITLPRATVQQALGAIDLYQRNEHCEDEFLIAGHFLRNALEQPKQEPICYASINKQGDVCSTLQQRDSWRTVPLYTTPPQQQAEPVALDKIKHCHTKMRLFDFEQHADHEYAGLPHRPYASTYSEGCYLCATLAEIERLQTKLEQQAGPVAWGMAQKDGLILDVICPEEHQSYEGEYTIPLYTTPPQRKPLTDRQADQIISGLQTCHHQSSKREFLKVWLRDWAAHGIKEANHG